MTGSRFTGAGLALVLALAVTPAFSVQPDEVLDDPVLESRARVISQDLRCPVCQGENIDESNAPISRDLRLYVRERLVAGDSNTEVVDAVAERFGEYVLFNPRAAGINWLLWLAGPLMALVAVLVSWRFLAARARAVPEASEKLTDEDKARLDQIMRGS